MTAASIYVFIGTLEKYVIHVMVDEYAFAGIIKRSLTMAQCGIIFYKRRW
jgi:hypothetical protein